VLAGGGKAQLGRLIKTEGGQKYDEVDVSGKNSCAFGCTTKHENSLAGPKALIFSTVPVVFNSRRQDQDKVLISSTPGPGEPRDREASDDGLGVGIGHFSVFVHDCDESLGEVYCDWAEVQHARVQLARS